jgi:alpha-mannosidase
MITTTKKLLNCQVIKIFFWKEGVLDAAADVKEEQVLRTRAEQLAENNFQQCVKEIEEDLERLSKKYLSNWYYVKEVDPDHIDRLKAIYEKQGFDVRADILYRSFSLRLPTQKQNKKK